MQLFSNSTRLLISLLSIGILTTLVVLAQKEIGDIDLGCPPASYRHGNYCYAPSILVNAPFSTAEMECERSGGMLAIVQDEETHQFLQRLAVRSYLSEYWIGLTDHAKEGQWVHVDGSHLGNDFNKWGPGEPNNAAKGEHCAYLWKTRGLRWNDGNCHSSLFYACQFNDTHCPESGNVFRQDNFCFLLSTVQATFSQASTACESLGGMLAMDKDDATHQVLATAVYEDRSWKRFNQTYVDSLLHSKEKDIWVRNWIGISRSSDGSWQHLDGTLVSLKPTFWGPQESPTYTTSRFLPSRRGKKEDCVASAQYWHMADCDKGRGFTCQYPVNSSRPDMNMIKPSTFDSLPTITCAPKAPTQFFVSAPTELSTQKPVTSYQTIFIILMVCCFVLGVGLTIIVVKREGLKRKIQNLMEKRSTNDNINVRFATLDSGEAV